MYFLIESHFPHTFGIGQHKPCTYFPCVEGKICDVFNIIISNPNLNPKLIAHVSGCMPSADYVRVTPSIRSKQGKHYFISPAHD